MKFNEKLIELRKKHGISQEELGNKINVSRQAISKWESEQAKPEVDKIKEISKVFNVSIEYLLNDELNEDIKIKKTKDKKKIKKIILIILLVVVSIYLIISFYKLVILLIYNVKINNIPDYQNYNIWSRSIFKDELKNEYDETCVRTIYSDGIEIGVVYEEELENDWSINYINYRNRTAYSLTWDSEISKYVYEDTEKYEDDLDLFYTHYSIKDNAKSTIPSEIGEIIAYAFNPQIKVKFIDNSLCIISNGAFITLTETSQHFETYIDKNTGFINKFIIVDNENDYYIKNIVEYDIGEDAIDEYYIEQEYLNELEYVMAEEVYMEENY